MLPSHISQPRLIVSLCITTANSLNNVQMFILFTSSSLALSIYSLSSSPNISKQTVKHTTDISEEVFFLWSGYAHIFTFNILCTCVTHSCNREQIFPILISVPFKTISHITFTLPMWCVRIKMPMTMIQRKQ